MRIPFGKHKGRTIAWIAEHDIDYLTWLLDQAFFYDEFPDLYEEAENALIAIVGW